MEEQGGNVSVADNPKPRKNKKLFGVFSNRENPKTILDQALERENRRRVYFGSMINFSAFIVLVLICFFIYQIYANPDLDWHIALMLILPATTILLALLQVLKYKDPKESNTDKENLHIMFSLSKEVVDLFKSK